MNEFGLTDEQKEAFQKAADIIQSLVEIARELWKKVRQAIDAIARLFKDYIMHIQPRKRYKFLKRLGIVNYVQYFRRDGIIHCRNNC